MTNYRYGYARVSTAEQDAALQVDAPRGAGAGEARVFIDVAAGALGAGPAVTCR